MKISLTPETLEAVFARKGFAWFVDDSRKFNLNLVGLRTATRRANVFDDWFFCGYKYAGVWRYDVWAWTTDPGDPWLRQPMNPAGCAILCPGQYRATWQIGLHRRAYTALVQRQPVRVFRDGNRDTILDYNPATIDQGLFGINIHRNFERGAAEVVGKFSAGCQVAHQSRDFYLLMARAEDAAAIYGNTFTYALLTEGDFL